MVWEGFKDWNLKRNHAVRVSGGIVSRRDHVASQGHESQGESLLSRLAQPVSEYEDEVERVGSMRRVRTYLRIGNGGRTLVAERFLSERGRRPNRFAGRPFEDALVEVLSRLGEADPDAAADFRDAFASALWYGRPTWTNRLDD